MSNLFFLFISVNVGKKNDNKIVYSSYLYIFGIIVYYAIK